MNKILLTFVLSISIGSVLLAQTYYPIPVSETYWQYSYSSIPMSCPCWGLCYKEQLKVDGDTLINGMLYHKVTRKVIHYDENCDESFYYAGYQGAIRNEEEARLVWFIPSGSADKELLYDFNLEAGDALGVSYLNPNGFNFYVDEIDWVEVGNTFRKRYKILGDLIMGEMPLEIIEGIGGQNLIAPFTQWMTFEEGYNFDCINISDSLIYPLSADCGFMVNTNKYLEKEYLNIFPNPSSGKFWLSFFTNEKRSFSIEVLNSMGEKLKQFESEKPMFFIDLSDYDAGMYFVKIGDNSKNFIRKLILQ